MTLLQNLDACSHCDNRDNGLHYRDKRILHYRTGLDRLIITRIKNLN